MQRGEAQLEQAWWQPVGCTFLGGVGDKPCPGDGCLAQAKADRAQTADPAAALQRGEKQEVKQSKALLPAVDHV